MRKCNPRLAQFRKRREALLPRIAQWTLLGLSLPEWTLLCFIAMALWGLWLARKRTRLVFA